MQNYFTKLGIVINWEKKKGLEPVRAIGQMICYETDIVICYDGQLINFFEGKLHKSCCGY